VSEEEAAELTKKLEIKNVNDPEAVPGLCTEASLKVGARWKCNDPEAIPGLCSGSKLKVVGIRIRNRSWACGQTSGVLCNLKSADE
jgi:hypothetical protein